MVKNLSNSIANQMCTWMDPLSVTTQTQVNSWKELVTGDSHNGFSTIFRVLLYV